MKRIIALVLTISLLMAVFTGCSKKKESKKTRSSKVTEEDVTPTAGEDIEKDTDAIATKTEVIDSNGYTYQVGNHELAISIRIEDYLDDEGRWHFLTMFEDLGFSRSDPNSYFVWTDDVYALRFCKNSSNNVVGIDYWNLEEDTFPYNFTNSTMDNTYELYGFGIYIPLDTIITIVYIIDNYNNSADPLNGVFDISQNNTHTI